MDHLTCRGCGRRTYGFVDPASRMVRPYCHASCMAIGRSKPVQIPASQGPFGRILALMKPPMVGQDSLTVYGIPEGVDVSDICKGVREVTVTRRETMTRETTKTITITITREACPDCTATPPSPCSRPNCDGTWIEVDRDEEKEEEEGEWEDQESDYSDSDVTHEADEVKVATYDLEVLGVLREHGEEYLLVKRLAVGSLLDEA